MDPVPANHDQRNHRMTRQMKHLIYLLTLLTALSAVAQPVRALMPSRRTAVWAGA